MKTTINITTGLALMILLAGCVVTSVYPFYNAKDVVFDPALVGMWVETDSTTATNDHWQFEKADDQAYKLTILEAGKRTEFDAHLFELKDRRFLDFYPRERAEHSLPAHYLLQITRIEPTLEVHLLDYDWLKTLVDNNPAAIRHIMIPKRLGESGEGDLVLTADTTELQKFLLQHEKTEEAFGKGSVMNRWKP